MDRARTAVFLINLVQDVNVLRPLVFMATRDFGLPALLLVSTKFNGRDLFGIWQHEIEEICRETGSRLEYFSSDWEAHRHLGGEGIIFAASESHLYNHVTTHSVFRHAPAGFVRVTLQHGFECVGFRHSADHVRAHGAMASFGADLVCTWYDADRLASMPPSQRSKVVVTGPTAVLQSFSSPVERSARAPGIVCENLHSVRLNGVRDFKGEFVGAFGEFCALLERDGREVVLRPHPGGQYVLKNKVPLAPNARINNAPIFRLDMRQFGYGISAPSSVLIDMVLAGIPTAVWRDRRGDMDADNYAGLTTVSSPAEWLEFSRAATHDPQPFLTRQKHFLDAQAMPLEPADVYERYSEIFRMALRMEIRPERFVPERERILLIANARVPTLQLSFEKPLAALVDRGEITTSLLTEQRLREEPNVVGDPDAESAWVTAYLDRFDPSLIVFCRYSGPAYEPVLAWARREKVPVVYHIDDDLLAIPEAIGERKFAHHNAEERLTAVSDLLGAADLIYASTEKLARRLLGYDANFPVVAGKIYCSGEVLRSAEVKTPCKVGYMASADHAHNLQMVLPAVEQLLDRNPGVHLELFGSIAIPEVLERFSDRISTAPPIADYGKFLVEFAKRGWDVGICPLAPIDFNMMKADTKWVEYTSVGAAVVASRGTVYDDCCADDCGVLADGVDEWLAGLELLVNDPRARLGIVERAQQRLRREYSLSSLREQVCHVFERARNSVKDRHGDKNKEDNVLCVTA